MIALSLALALAAPAGSLGNPKAEDLVRLRAFAGCVVARNPGTARRLLASDFRDRTFNAERQDLVSRRGDCLTREKPFMLASGLLFSGALAEAMLRTIPADRVTERLALAPEQTLVTARDEVELTALCTVRRKPAEAAAMLGTTAGSEGEAMALRPLVSELPGCLAKGVTGRFNKPSLRALIALATYRIVELGGTPSAMGKSS